MKKVYQSKEVWVAVLAVLNTVFYSFGLPAVEPTPELLTAIVGLLGAIRILFTKSQLVWREVDKSI